MRVGLVTSVPMPPEEGIGYYVWNLARQLIRRGHAIHIITRGQPERDRCEHLGGVVVWRPTFLPLYPFHVHIHGWYVRRLLARLEHQVDIFHFHTPLPPAVRTVRPVLLTVHTPMRAESRSTPLRDLHALLIKLQTPVSYRIEHRLLRSAAHVAVVAQSVANELHEYGVNPAKVTVLGNGVDQDRFAPNGKQRVDPPVVLAAGRLERRKGFEDLVDCARLVCKEHKMVRFWIAGKGPLERMLKTSIQQAGLEERVTLLGHVGDRERMITLYQQATVFIHPAHYEGLPTVLLEAMSCSRPVISTAVSGALDVLTSGENGILVPPHDPLQMSEAISTLLADPQLRARLGQAARHTIKSRFSWELVCDNYIKVYQQVLAENARAFSSTGRGQERIE